MAALAEATAHPQDSCSNKTPAEFPGAQDFFSAEKQFCHAAPLLQAAKDAALAECRTQVVAATAAAREARNECDALHANAASVVDVRGELSAVARDRDAAYATCAGLRAEATTQQRRIVELQFRLEQARSAAALARERAASVATRESGRGCSPPTRGGLVTRGLAGRPRARVAWGKRTRSGPGAGIAAAGMASLMKQIQQGSKRLEELSAVRPCPVMGHKTPILSMFGMYDLITSSRSESILHLLPNQGLPLCPSLPRNARQTH
jgi:hypothetical protein